MGRGSAPSEASKDERPGCLDTLAATAGPSPFEARRRGSHLRVTVMECARRFSIVFASVAKQSRNFPRRQSGLLRSARNDGASGEAIALQFTSQTAGTSSRSRGACRPSFASSIALIETRAQGRPGAGWHPQVRALQRVHTGWTTGDAGRPAFPARMVLTVSFVLSSGSDALLPPSPHGWLMCASGRAAHITARLDAQTPGVGTTRLLRPRTSSHASSTAGVCSPSRPCEDAVGAVSFARRQLLTVSRPAMPLAPDAVASIAARPAVRDDRDPPLVSGQGVQCVR
jgi:hypothetical protein